MRVWLLLGFLLLVGFPAHSEDVEERDVVLIGTGIMSATLGTLINELDPTLKLTVFERLDQLSGESSEALNNAGTGHSALAELNYTPENDAGEIETEKALEVMNAFELSKQYWAHLVDTRFRGKANDFIHSVPHMSFVSGDANVDFLRRRHAALSQHTLFNDMQYSEDPEQLRKWIPAMMQGRNPNEKIAATRSEMGTDVDFGRLSRMMLEELNAQSAAEIHTGHEVRDIYRDKDGSWILKVWDSKNQKLKTIDTKFLFIGAGGAALPLLQKSGIPEARGYGGFPISGEFLISYNPELVAQHDAKVYGKASEGSPPMSVPHLDTRVIDGKRALLFGPFAGATTQFLKHGSFWDLAKSIRPHNVLGMLKSGYKNIDLIQYLLSQVTQSSEDRMNALRAFLPNARAEDWRLITAGQRVQINYDGNLRFGTEVVTASDGSLAALLGASPGASTSVSVMLEVLENCFQKRFLNDGWRDKIQSMIPAYEPSFQGNEGVTKALRSRSHYLLGLTRPVFSCERHALH